MSKSLVEIKGFKELETLLKKLPDNVKKSELNKIFGQVANTTLKVAQQLAPVSSKVHIQKRKGQTFGKYINPGTGRASIAKKAMTKTTNAVVSVSPRSRKKADGFYLRRFVIPGTKRISANSFMDEAYKQTKGKVSAESEKQVARYIQKRIDSLIK